MKNRWMFLSGFLLLAGCAGLSSDTGPALDGFWCDLTGAPATFVLPPIALNELPAYPHHCLPGDHQVPTAPACPVDAACYQLDTGIWCAGGGAP